METASAAARAPLDITPFFEVGGEVDGGCVLVEENTVDLVVDDDEDDVEEPRVVAAPAWKRVALNAVVTTLPFKGVVVCRENVLMTVDDLKPA
jgi:hypothetical protein